MSRSILVTLLALGVGLGVGYLAGSTRESPARSDRPAVETPTVQPEPLPETASDLARILHEIPAPTWERGSGRITGVVRDDEGNGVAGVTIRATQRGKSGTRRTGDGVPETDTLEQAVQKAVKRYHWRRQTTVDAVTDAGGAYVLDGLADRGYGLQAFLEGYQVRADRGAQVWNVEPGDAIDWIASPVVTLPIDVLMPDGTRPSQAWIQCKRGSHPSSEHWTPERPEIRVAPGAYTFSVSLSGNQGYRSEAVEAVVEAGRPADPITFRLVGRPGIRGSIRLGTGERFSSLHVYALRFGGAEAPSDTQLGAHGKHAWAGEGNGYRFSFMDLAPGRYLVGVGLRRSEMLAKTTVDVGEQMVDTELVVDRIDPEYYVVVRVLGPDGEPAVVEQVSTSYETANSSRSGGSAWARRKDGSYIVFHQDHNMEEGGTYGIELTAKDYGRKRIEYRRGKQREFEVRFRAPATLAVVVTGFQGSEHAGKVTLGLSRRLDGRRTTSATESRAPDADGRVVLGPVESGEYELVLQIRTHRHMTTPALRRPVTLPAGESETTVAMPRLHELVVTGEKGQSYTLSADRDAGYWYHESQRCGDDGRALFGPLPAGKYTLRRSGEPGEMNVTVPCGEVVFEASEYNALKVTIRDADGMLAKAGFADGDLVVGIDGMGFKGTAQMQMLFAAAMMRGEEATLTLLRGGRTMELTVNLEEIMEGAGARPGGSVRPVAR